MGLSLALYSSRQAFSGSPEPSTSPTDGPMVTDMPSNVTDAPSATDGAGAYTSTYSWSESGIDDALDGNVVDDLLDDAGEWYTDELNTALGFNEDPDTTWGDRIEQTAENAFFFAAIWALTDGLGKLAGEFAENVLGPVADWMSGTKKFTPNDSAFIIGHGLTSDGTFTTPIDIAFVARENQAVHIDTISSIAKQFEGGGVTATDISFYPRGSEVPNGIIWDTSGLLNNHPQLDLYGFHGGGTPIANVVQQVAADGSSGAVFGCCRPYRSPATISGLVATGNDSWFTSGMWRTANYSSAELAQKPYYWDRFMQAAGLPH